VDFRDSPAEAAFRAEARAFLEAHAGEGPPDVVGYFDAVQDDEALLERNRRWQRLLHEHGLAALTWPVEHGGRGKGPIEQIVWSQELARAGVGESLYVVGIGMAGPTLIAHGTSAQKERFLGPMLRGEEIWCQLFSEPGAGSDLASVATRAERDGDEWVVTGQKTWCSGGHYADFGILLARSDPDAPKHEGLTYFLLDMRASGVTTRPLREMTGASHFGEVFLDAVRVPDANRLGAVGAGWQVARTTLLNERMAIGGVERWFQWDRLLALAREHPERLDARLRDQLALLWTRVRTLELLNARVITKLGRGEIPHAEGSVMKLALADVMTRSAELGMELLGPEALARRGHWPSQFLGAPALHIAGGTDEIQKNVAAERVLGLPR